MTPSPQKAADFRPDINGLRAVAVLLVVFYHLGVERFHGGFVGVDVFFVISGFLMTKLILGRLESGGFSLGGFYLARARRIVPALLVLCAAVLGFGALALPPVDYAATAWHAASAAGFLSNFAFLQESGYFDAAAAEKWLLHTWSLSVEWQFYLLFPLLVLAVGKLSRARVAIPVALGAVFLLSLGASVLWTSRDAASAYFLLPTRAWEMLAGGLVYLAGRKFRPSALPGRLLEGAGLALIVFSALWFSADSAWPGYRAILPVAGAMLVILASNAQSLITTNPVARFIGDSSYSIYLWHWPVAVVLGLRGLTDDWRWVAFGIALSLLLGYLSYRLVETPSRSWRTSRKSEALAYAGATAVVVACGLSIQASDGFPGRMGANEQAYAASSAAIADWVRTVPHCIDQGDIHSCESKGSEPGLVMFVGDSIAQQWFPRYGEKPAVDGLSVLFAARPGCPPVRDMEGYPFGMDCGRNAAKIWALVRERRPQLLVLSSQWWLTYFYPTGELRGQACRREGDECVAITDLAQLERAFSTLERDIAEATARGTRVVLLDAPPWARVDYASARLTQLADESLPLAIGKSWQLLSGFKAGRVDLAEGMKTIGSAGTPAAFFVPDTAANAPEQIMSDLLTRMASRSGARVVSSREFLCPDNRCPLADADGISIYKDAMHLRARYVRSDALQWLDRELGIDTAR